MPDHSTTHSGRQERGATNSEGISIMKDSTVGATKSRKKARIEYSRWRRRLLAHVTTIRIFIILLFVGGVALVIFLLAKGTQALNIPVYFNTAYNFAFAPIGQLASYNGRTNILVMGKAGGVHDGPDLTDTMMLVSISLTNHDVKIISIPRDLWIPEIRAKINSAYYWGDKNTPYFDNSKNPGGKIGFAKAITFEVVGVPVQYGAVIDFSGFKDTIDALGGIQVNVVNSFTDYFYPIAGRENDTCGGGDSQFMCRYETLTFSSGSQIMNGDTALKFVRSRHAEGIEGSDTAREARQQKVIDAVKNKIIDKNTYMNPGKDLAVLKAVLGSLTTDMDYPTMATLARLVYDGRNSISNNLIPQDLLFNPPASKTYDLQEVVIPAAGSGKWEEINKWVSTILQTQTY